jgi:hypothetical protein
MLDGVAQGRTGTEAVAGQVHLTEAEVFDQCGQVVAEGLGAKGPVGVTGVAVARRVPDGGWIRYRDLSRRWFRTCC